MIKIFKNLVFWAVMSFVSCEGVYAVEELLLPPKTEDYIKILGDIDSVVENALKLFNVPGAALSIVVDDKLIYAQGYGTRSIDENTPVTAETLFPVGSVTKSFTALIIGQLVDEQKISWD